MRDKVKKAIEQLERVSNSLASIGETVDYTDIAIKALEQQPCDDCISRQALIEKATSWDKHFADSERCVSLTDIQNAPSVTLREEKTYEQGYADGFAECLDLNT